MSTDRVPPLATASRAVKNDIRASLTFLSPRTEAADGGIPDRLVRPQLLYVTLSDAPALPHWFVLRVLAST
jgi:hypothetical protein